MSGSLASIERASVCRIVVRPLRGAPGQEHPAALADGGEQVEHPDDALVVRVLVLDLQVEGLGGEGRRQLLEPGTLGTRLELDVVDGVDPQDGGVLLVAEGGTGAAGDHVALAQPELTHLLHRHVAVVLGRQEAVDPQEAVAVVAEVEATHDGYGLTGELLLLAAAVPVATPAPTSPATTLAVVVVLLGGVLLGGVLLGRTV